MTSGIQTVQDLYFMLFLSMVLIVIIYGWLQWFAWKDKRKNVTL